MLPHERAPAGRIAKRGGRQLRRAAVCVLALVLGALHGSTTAHTTDSRSRAIEREARAWMARHRAPSVSIAVVHDGRIVWQGAYGWADVARRVPASPNTAYRLASISKSITATAVMQLAQRGKMDLDAPIQRYCPAYPLKPWPVSARQLLAHLAGVRHYSLREQLWLNRRHYPTVEDSLRIFATDPLEHQPGKAYRYSTYGYSVLGCAIEGASGQSYVDYVSRHILGPAGMRRTRPDDATQAMPGRAALYSKGWLYGAFGVLPTFTTAQALDNSDRLPGGGYLSTAPDLARLAIALEDGRLLGRASLEQMWTRQRTLDGTKLPFYALGWLVKDGSPQRPARVWNDGDQAGTRTYLLLIPERRFAVALMTNMDGAPCEELIPAIERIFGVP